MHLCEAADAELRGHMHCTCTCACTALRMLMHCTCEYTAPALNMCCTCCSCIVHSCIGPYIALQARQLLTSRDGLIATVGAVGLHTTSLLDLAIDFNNIEFVFKS